MKRLITTFTIMILALTIGRAESSDFILPENYDGLPVADILGLLPSDSFALIRSTQNIPESWPQEIKETIIQEMNPGGLQKNVIWYATTDGINWQRYYAFAIDVYLNEHKAEPAFIYERSKTESGIMYIPVMQLMISPEDVVIFSSKKWCQAVLDNME